MESFQTLSYSIELMSWVLLFIQPDEISQLVETRSCQSENFPGSSHLKLQGNSSKQKYHSEFILA